MDQFTLEKTVMDMARKARKASRNLSVVSTAVKNNVLLKMAKALRYRQDYITTENEKDLAAGREKKLSTAMLDRLALTDKVISSMVQGLEEVAALADPIGEISSMKKRPSGINVGRMRVPLGVVGMIYESRPNVTVDAAALCLKAGNAVVLRGGSEAIHSNLALASIFQETLSSEGVDSDCVQVIPVTNREAVKIMLSQEEYIDLIIPRGGEGLIRFVSETSRIPVLKHYKGVCHAYVDESADPEMAINIVLNGKTQRPGVCNALEGLLVNKEIAADFLPIVAAKLLAAGVELRGCQQSMSLVPEIKKAEEGDWGCEFLDLILAVKVVDDMDDAMHYIEQYGSHHTEIIITNNYDNAQVFLRKVDASAVMVNASTRFNDGGEFGLGAEIGISTTKLHAYGPMGLEELTTRKFIVCGEGEIRV